MKDKLTFDAFYPHPPEKVWEALTNSEALGQWLLPADFKPVPGYRFRFDELKRPGRASVEGTVIDAEPAYKLTYTWEDGEAGNPSVISWTLQPKDGGTQVHLEHAAAVYAEPYVLIEASMNWRFALYGSMPEWLHRNLPPTPIVYVSETPQEDNGRRAGFRQLEEATC